MQALYAKFVSGGKFIAANCPFCVNVGKTPDTKFHLYIKKDHWVYCYKCGYKSSFTKFSEQFSLSLDRKVSPIVVTQAIDSFATHLKKVTQDFNQSMYADGARGYLFKRRVTPEIVEKLNIRLGVDLLFGRVAFIDDVNKYYVARAFLPNVEPKTLNTPNSVKPLMYFRKGSYRTIYLVEGTFDMLPFLKTDRHVFALLGKDVSDYQLKQLSSLIDVFNVIIALDCDAFENAKKLAHIISGVLPFASIGIVMYDNRDGKDPADLDVDFFFKTSLHWVRVMHDEESYDEI